MYSESDRNIFGPFYNGSEMVHADPLRIRRLLVHELGGDLNAVLSQAHAEEEPVRFQARDQLLSAARIAFDMTPFNPATGAGAVEADLWAALTAFLDFIEKKNPSGVSGPTSVPSTDPKSLLASVPPFVPTAAVGMKDTSGLSSIFHDSDFAVPGK